MDPDFSGNRKIALVSLLLICSFFAACAMVAGHEHSLDRSDSCGVCHLGHLSWISPHLAASAVPTIVEQWLADSARSQYSQDPRISFSSPRAPPL